MSKTIEKFTEDPEKYLTQAIENTQKMPNERVAKVTTKSAMIGAVIGLATIGLSVLTGSKKELAVATGVGVGTLVGTASGLAQAHDYGTIKQTKDKVNELKKW